MVCRPRVVEMSLAARSIEIEDRPLDVVVIGNLTEATRRILTPAALDFVATLHLEFGARRRRLLAAREERQAALDAGGRPDFLADTAQVRQGDWRVAPAPPDLDRRWVEITGPVDRKMVINALNSGADCFMADFEDSLSPTWPNVIDGQANLYDAVRRQIDFRAPNGKAYELGSDLATLLVRPRGWHLEETRIEVDGEPISASLFDFGMFFFHNARELVAAGSGPYFYLAKLQGHREARLWNDVFTFAQASLGISHGTIRATVLIEHVLAAFEMDEILFELRDHIAGLNAGRWDYIFSAIKTFSRDSGSLLPDRANIGMNVPFMRAYTELLVKTCHRRGAHAIGGMAAFIPSRRDAELNERALAAVRADKDRESRDGFDGTWIAHPDLAPVAYAAFQEVLGTRSHQKDVLREDVDVDADQLLAIGATPGEVTRAGVELNVSVALQYLTWWLRGVGAVAINNLMEDTATAEISRTQLWQWLQHGVHLEDGEAFTTELYRDIRTDEVNRLEPVLDDGDGWLTDAAELLDTLVLADQCGAFLTLEANKRL